jgi:uncharacterized protein YjbJ (UPF0337 family)
MEWQQIEAQWTQLKGAVKEQWGRFTDDDLLEIAGRREQLLAQIRKRYRMAADEAERQIAEWERRIDEGPPPID